MDQKHSKIDDETIQIYRVAEWLVDFGVERVGMKEDISHKGPGYVLANAGIKTHLLSCDDLRQAVSEISAAGL